MVIVHVQHSWESLFINLTVKHNTHNFFHSIISGITPDLATNGFLKYLDSLFFPRHGNFKQKLD